MSTQSPAGRVRPRIVRALVRKEWIAGTHNYWVAGTSLLFLTLIIAGSVFAEDVTMGSISVSSWQATVQNSTRLVLPLLSIIALMLSYNTVSGEIADRSMQVLLSTPITRLEVIVGKLLGLATVPAVAAGLGVVMSGLIIVRDGVVGALVPLAAYVGGVVLFSLAFVSIGLLISTVAESRSTAAALAIGVWFTLQIGWNTFLYGGTEAFAMQVAGDYPAWFYAILVLNPVEAFRAFNAAVIGTSMNMLPAIADWPWWFNAWALAGVLAAEAGAIGGITHAVFRSRDIQ